VAAWSSRTASSMLRAVRVSSCPARRRIPPSPRARPPPSFRRCRVSAPSRSSDDRCRLRTAHGALQSLAEREPLRRRRWPHRRGAPSRAWRLLRLYSQDDVPSSVGRPNLDEPFSRHAAAGADGGSGRAASRLDVPEEPTVRLRCGDRGLGGGSHLGVAGWYAHVFFAEPGAPDLSVALAIRVAFLLSPDAPARAGPLYVARAP